MGSMESFYGGRQGASFVIVKRFDGIDIPKNTIYKIGWFAQDSDGYFYVPLIERNGRNYNLYSWDTIPRDGVTTVTSKSGITSSPLPVEYAEGMKQCFEKGGATTSAVGYGEYVIIDTISGLGEYGSLDNGKVYRRGMNYDTDLGGAEYIGQIIGPKGDSPELDMDTVADIMTHPGSKSDSYDMSAGDAQDGIVPGKYEDTTGTIQYNDSITYAWVSLRDSHNNIIGALIGFTFPYLIPEFTSSQRSAYYTIDDYNAGRITDPTLIGTVIKESDNFSLLVDNGLSTPDRDPSHGDTGHAFYRKWKLTIPHGIKGDTQTQLEIVPQKLRAGSNLWNSSDFTQPPVDIADNNTYVILDDNPFPDDCVYPYDNSSAVVAVEKISMPGITYYAKIEDTYMLKFRYRQTWYDDHEDGSDYNIIDLGDYNTIRKIWISNDGYIWVRYNADEDGIINSGTPVTWIESVALANQNNPSVYDPEGNLVNSGHFRIIYNNDNVVNKTGTWIDSSGISHAIWESDLTWPQSVSLNTDGLLKFLYNNNLYYDKSIYTDPIAGTYEFEIPWITSVLIQQNGTFTLSYNNEVNAGAYPASEWNSTTHTWTTMLDFIDHVTIDNDGSIHFWYSNGKEAPNTGYLNIKIRYLINAEVRTGLKPSSIYDFDGEGTGDQKIQLTWNTETIPGVKDTSVIGAPLNYIMETIVTTYDPKAPATPQNHLLVLYSDPVYRAWLASKYPDKIYTYTSKKFTQADPTSPTGVGFVTRNDWFDLGYVKGEPGGLHIIGEYILSYKVITPIGTENPSALGWYEFVGGAYILSTDTTVNPSKTYYEKETYKDYLDDTIPPELMPGNTPDDRGWAYLITDLDAIPITRIIYTYDYVHSRWIIAGDISNAGTDPKLTVIMDTASVDPVTGLIIPTDPAYAGLPNEEGLWFTKYTIKTAY